MCRPHSGSATTPIRSRGTKLPMISPSKCGPNGQAVSKRQRIISHCEEVYTAGG
jgi:hypothetical protein